MFCFVSLRFFFFFFFDFVPFRFVLYCSDLFCLDSITYVFVFVFVSLISALF